MFKAELKYNKKADLVKVARSMRTNIEEVQKKMLGEASIELMENTPIKTGRAAMGWAEGVKAAGMELPELTSPDMDEDAMKLGASESEVKKTRNGYSVINKVPYIIELELGSSTQAPGGFMRISGKKALRNTHRYMKPVFKKAMKAGNWGI